MEINKSIGVRLRLAREALGKTQTDLADCAAAAGVPGATRQSQAKYEKGLAAPSAAYLAAMAAAGLDVQYVLIGEALTPTLLQHYQRAAQATLAADSPNVTASYLASLPAVHAQQTAREQALLAAYRKLKEGDRAALEHMAKALAGKNQR